MLGAIFGDIAGSVYEFNNTSNYNFEMLTEHSRPTDDSYMTLAVARALMETYGKDDETIKRAVVKRMQEFGRKYPDGDYGIRFSEWLLEDDPKPYRSFGNGSAMRVAAAGWLYQTLDETLHAAKLTAEVTHNHPEGIKGAQAVAAAIFLARAGADKDEIMSYISNKFGYDLLRSLAEIKPYYEFYETCQKSVPEAIIAFYEGENYEDVIRKSISLGGDSDTIACMAGSIAEAYFGMPEEFKEEALARLTPELRQIAEDFSAFYDEHSGAPKEGWEDDVKDAFLPDDPFAKLNPFIEQLMDEYYYDPENDRKILNIFDAIVIAMGQEGRVLIPVEAPDDKDQRPRVIDPRSVRIEDLTNPKEETHWRLIQLQNAEGNISLPVFTSRKKLREGGAGDCSTVSLSMEEYFKQVLARDEVEGIVINPGAKSLFLGKALLGSLIRQNEANKPKQEKASAFGYYVKPFNVPRAFKDALAEFVENNLPEVEKLWLTGIVDGEEESLVLAIKTKASNPQIIFDRMNTLVAITNLKRPVNYTVADDKPWAGAELIYSKEPETDTSAFLEPSSLLN